MVMKNRPWHQILRIGVSVGLVVLLLSLTNLAQLSKAFAVVNVWYLLAALMLAFSQLAIGAYRWQIMLSPKAMQVPLHSLMAIYLVGSLFNKFLPTVSGIQLLCLRFLGEYIGRMYREVKRRPPYIIREKLGTE